MSGKKKWIVPNGDVRKHYDVFKVEISDNTGEEVVTHVSEHAREEDARTHCDALAALDSHLVNALGMPEHWVGQKYLVRTRPSKAHTIYSTNHAKFAEDYSPVFTPGLIGAGVLADTSGPEWETVSHEEMTISPDLKIHIEEPKKKRFRGKKKSKV